MLPNRQLRPLSISELLDTAFSLYRRHFWTLTGIVALIHLPLIIAKIIGSMAGTQTISTFLMLTFQGFSVRHTAFWLFLFGNLINAALIRAISSRYVGTPTSVLSSYRLNIGRYAVLVSTSCLPIAIECIRVALRSITVYFLPILFLWGVLQIPDLILLFFSTYVLIVPQVSLLENRGIFGTLQRSWLLVRSSPYRTFGILLLAYLLGILIYAAPSFLLSIIPRGFIQNYTYINYLYEFFLIAVPMVILPLQTLIYTLLYYDLRVRYEGYDLELRTKESILASSNTA